MGERPARPAAVALAIAVLIATCAQTPPRAPEDLDTLASYPPTAVSGSPVRLAGAGDIARCDRDADEATAMLLEQAEAFVFTAGDNAYERGSPTDYADCFEPSWGRFRERTFPAPGNHDWETANAAGYFGYFGDRAGDPRAGWYATDLGAWRLIVLAANCDSVGGCDGESPQGRWLARELERNASRCTLAIWHQPLFSTGAHGPSPAVRPFWEQLHAAGAELVLNGHEHSYERFRPLDPDGQPDPEGGIRQIVVGTGGADLRGFHSEDPNSEVRDGSSHGVLVLELDDGSFAWEFVPVTAGGFTDSGRGTCR